MAESSLSLSYSEFQGAVGRYIGWNSTTSSWTSDNSSDFAKILGRGLRRAYFPLSDDPNDPVYEWSFLRVFTTQLLVVSDWDYTLPDNFSGVIVGDSVTYSYGSQQVKLKGIVESDIRAMQSKEGITGTPEYYAVRPLVHAPTTGQRYEIILYPTPDAALTLRYGFTMVPEVLTASNIYPAGGALYSEMFLEAILAEAELFMDDDPAGPHNVRFAMILKSAIRADKLIKSQERMK